MAKSGMNPKVLQYLMGHSDISVTLNTYTHLKLDDAKEEMEKLAQKQEAAESELRQLGMKENEITVLKFGTNGWRSKVVKGFEKYFAIGERQMSEK